MKILSLILTLFTAACLATATAVRAESDFTFKGFSLGMSLDDAEKLIKEKYSDVFGKVTTEPYITISGSMNYYAINIHIFGISLPVVFANSQKHVTEFRFPGGPAGVVDKLFNSGDMPARDFAKQFLHSYNIPELKASRFMLGMEMSDGWEYTSPKGFHVRICMDKTLIVEVVPAASERKFD